MTEFSALNGEQQEQVTRPFNEFNAAIERQKLIAVIRDTLRRFEEVEYHRILEKIYKTTEHTEYTEKNQGDCQAQTTAIEGSDTSTYPKVKEPSYSVSSVYSVVKNTSFDKAWLADETDVERYLESMREALLDEIRKGKRIQI